MWQPYDLRFDGTTKTFIYKLFFTDLAGKNWREPLPQPVPRSKVQEIEQSLSNPGILDVLQNDPDHVLVVNGTGSNQGDIYRVEIATGRATRIQRADEKDGQLHHRPRRRRACSHSPRCRFGWFLRCDRTARGRSLAAAFQDLRQGPGRGRGRRLLEGSEHRLCAQQHRSRQGGDIRIRRRGAQTRRDRLRAQVLRRQRHVGQALQGPGFRRSRLLPVFRTALLRGALQFGLGPVTRRAAVQAAWRSHRSAGTDRSGDRHESQGRNADGPHLGAIERIARSQGDGGADRIGHGTGHVLCAAQQCADGAFKGLSRHRPARDGRVEVHLLQGPRRARYSGLPAHAEHRALRPGSVEDRHSSAWWSLGA